MSDEIIGCPVCKTSVPETRIFPKEGLNLKNLLSAIQTFYIVRALARVEQKSEGAALLGVNRTTFTMQLQKFGLFAPKYPSVPKPE
jgi:transcriptional regulator with PAS, ATPase and Fis domain